MNVGLVAVVMGIGCGIIAIITEHFQKMAKINADASSKSNAEVMTAIASLRQEIADLRDTSTSYDVSFDTALQRMEARVARLETNSREQESLSAGTNR